MQQYILNHTFICLKSLLIKYIYKEDIMSKKKIKLPLRFWKNPIRYVKFHKALNKVKKSM